MNTNRLQLLIVEDEEAHVEAIRRAFDATGATTDIHAVGTLREYRAHVAAHPPDIALLDLNLPDGRAVDVLTHPPEDAPFPILVMTAFGTQQIVVEVMKAGALDYVVKSPEAFATLPHTVERVLREWTLRQGRKRAEEALQRSEEKYRLLIENSHDILYTLTAEGVFTFVSPAWTALLGHPTTRVDGQPFQQFVHPDDLAGCLAFLQSTIETGQRQKGVEYRVRHLNGSWCWHTSSAVPLRDEAGTVIGFEGTARDITERKQVAETLRIQHDLSLALASIDDLHQALEQILEAALQLEGMDCGGIYLADSSGGLELVVHRGLTPEFVEQATHYPAETLQARLAREGRARFGSYQSFQPEPDAASTTEGLRALAVIPVLHQGQLLAVLNLASHTYDAIPTNTRQAVETVALQIGSILMHLRDHASLRESQQNMQTLFDTIEDFLFVLDGAGHILQVNAVTSNRLGYATDELVGQDVLMTHPPDRRAEAAAIIADMLAGQRDFCPVPLVTKDGVLIPVETRVTPGIWGGQPALFGLSRDITERKRTEAVRDEALSRLQKIASRVPGLVYEYRLRPDGSSCMPFASEAIRELFRVSPEEVREDASLLFAASHPDDRDARVASIQESARNLTPWQHEYRVKFDDGTVRWLFGNALPQREADGSTLWHGFITDITARKQAEAELQETNRQLEAATARANDLAVQAELATRAKSQFLANMSHEIRTPMTAILGYADLLLEEHIGQAAQEHVAVIKRSGEQLLGLINDILDLAKVEAGKLQIEPIRCSPGELVAEMVSFMRVRAAEKFLVLKTELGDPLPETVLTDPLRLRQVLINLLGNAIKFTDQGEIRLTVRLSSDGGPPRLCFDVTDTGIGMNAEQVGQLFQPFTQVDSSSTRKFGGTGLGLCISKHLAEALGGDLEVRSQPGRGSIFTLTIEPGPLDGIRLLHGSVGTALQPPPRAAPGAADLSVLHSRILLAEDCSVNQQFIALLLGRAGAEVTLAENGQLAVAAAWAAHEAGQPFDVILMDMSMPVLDGFEATRQLRQRGYTAPIIALTAYAMTEDRRKCLAAGCNDYAIKPIDRERLLATVASWTTRGCTPDAASAATPPASATRLPTAIYSDLDLADDPKMGELVAFLVSGMPDRIKAFEAQAQSRDWCALERSAHRLRGAAGACGFDTLMASASQLETALRETQSEERMLAAVAELVSLSRRLQAGIAPTPDFEAARFDEK